MRNFSAYVLILAAFVLSNNLDAAPLGTTFTYQGKLEQGGVDVTDTCDFNFGLWDASAGGAEVAGAIDALNVQVTGGTFTVELDYGAGVFGGDARWLEIAVACPAGGGLTTLAPRQELMPSPNALFAARAGAMEWTGLLNVPPDIADGDDVDDDDADPVNEIQDLSLGGNTLSLTGDASPVDLSGYLDNTDDQTLAEVLAQGNNAGGASISNVGTTTTSALTVSDLDCTAFDNGGALTTDGSGVVSCSDDDAGAGDGNTLDQAYDQGGAGAGRTITADSGAVTIEGAGGLTLDTGSLLQTPGDPVLVGTLPIGGNPTDVYVSGRYIYVVDGGSADLKVIDASVPTAPSLVGSIGIGSFPTSVYVSGRYAYVVDEVIGDLKVIDISKPSVPALTGSLVLGIGAVPYSVHVTGRYAYVVDIESDDLKVIDVSDPTTPSLAGSLGLGAFPSSVFVAGRYAFVADQGSDDLKVIDVSNPRTPSLAGSLGIGTDPSALYVSGRYAYVVDSSSLDLKVIDVSDPGAPTLAGSLGVGVGPTSVYVSGRYAYVVNSGAEDLKVVDVSDPTMPSLAGSLGIGSFPIALSVAGRYAYVVDLGTDDLKVIDVSGGEMTSLVAHSLEAGNLQVRNDVIAQGQAQFSGGLNAGSGGILSDGDIGVAGEVKISGDNPLTLSALDCTSNANGGALTVDSDGLVQCSDDDGSGQDLAEVLAQGNDAGGMTITNLPGPLAASDAATMAYVDAHEDADADPANELQDLSLGGNTLSLTGDASPVDLSGFLDNTDDQTLAEVLAQGNDAGGASISNIGTTTTNALVIAGLDCTGNANEGALTTDGSTVFCSDDDAGAAGGGNTLDQAYDQGGAGAGRTIIADSGAVAIEGAGGLDLDAGNLQQTPGNPVLVGNLSIGPTPVSLYVSGRYAYVIESSSNELKVIDLADPGAPRLVGTQVLGVGSKEIYVSGRYAYVLDVGSNELQVIDVSNPSSPGILGNVTVGGFPVEVQVSGHHAYVISESSFLDVIDVSDPNMPRLAGRVGIGGKPRSLFVSGRYAYVTDSLSSDLRVIDVSEPSKPIQVGIQALGAAFSIYVSGAYAYLNGGNDFLVVDVSDPSLPSVVGALNIGGALNTVYVSGRYAFMIDFSDGDLSVIDVSDPTAPSLAASLALGGSPEDIHVSGRFAYVVSQGSADLKVIDISGAEVTSMMAHSLEAGNLQVRNDVIAQGQLQVTGGVNVGSGGLFSDGDVGVAGDLRQTPDDPVQVGGGVAAGGESVYVSGRYAYVVATDSDSLEVFDVSDPSAPSLVGSLGIGGFPRSVFVAGRYAYVVDSSSDDLKVIDVSNPNTPSLAGSLDIGTLPTWVYVSGRYAYVVDRDSDDLRVIDVADPSMPRLTGSLGLGTAPRFVFVSGRYAYVIDELDLDLKVIDVSDPGAPSLVGSIGVGPRPRSVYVSGRYAYITDSISGDLKIFDVSDPAMPSLAGTLDLGSNTISVHVSGRYAYVSDDDSNELHVVDVSNPTQPRLVGSIGIGTFPRYIHVSGRYAYVVDQDTNDLRVIDISGAEVTSMMAHSLEAGNLQVRNDVIAQGQLQVAGGVSVGSGGLFSDGNVGVDGDIGVTGDKNFFAGDTGFGTVTPTHRLHVVDDPNGAASTANHVALIENNTTGNTADILVIKMPEIGSDIGAGNNYISFHDGGGGSMGAIQGNGAGSVTYAGAGNDYAEYLLRLDPAEEIRPGDLVGIHGGFVSKRTEGADLVLAASTGAIVAGNDPGEENRNDYTLVAFIGQAQLRVRGPVMAGDLIVPSGEGDGVGVAIGQNLLDAQLAGHVVGQAWETSADPGIKPVRSLVGLVQSQVMTHAFRTFDARLQRLERQMGIQKGPRP